MEFNKEIRSNLEKLKEIETEAFLIKRKIVNLVQDETRNYDIDDEIMECLVDIEVDSNKDLAEKRIKKLILEADINNY